MTQSSRKSVAVAVLKLLLLLTCCAGLVFLLTVGANGIAAIILDRYSKLPDGAGDPRIAFPVFPNKDTARQAFVDWYKTTAVYSAYEGFRLKPFTSATVNVDRDGLRRVLGQPVTCAGTVWMLGGSTMWGTGVTDAETIPAIVQSYISDKKVINYGQSGYLSLQNVAVIAKNIALGETPDTVISYDGVNDVFHLCSGSAAIGSHTAEPVMQRALQLYLSKKPGRSNLAKDALYGHLLNLGEVLLGKGQVIDIEQIPPDQLSASAATPEEAADALWRGWCMAKTLVESCGGRFIAILQPVSSVSKSKKDYLKPTPQWDEWYERAYRLIRHRIATEGVGWAYDLSGELDTTDNVFMDWCHLSEPGNKVMARSILSIINGDHSKNSKPNN